MIKLLWYGMSKNKDSCFYHYVYENEQGEIHLDYNLCPNREDLNPDYIYVDYQHDRDSDGLLTDQEILEQLEWKPSPIPKRYVEEIRRGIALRSL